LVAERSWLNRIGSDVENLIPGNLLSRTISARIFAVALLVLATTLAGCEDKVVREGGLDYVEVTVGPDDVDRPLPLLIAIHGLGDRPESFCEFMKSGMKTATRIVCPRAPDEYGRGFSWFPSMDSLSTAEMLASALQRAGELVAELTEVLARDARVLGKPVLVGYSQGGMTAYYLAITHSDLYAAIVPIAGMLPETLRARQPAGDPIPLFGFHGEDDGLVPFAEARRTADAFAARWPDTNLSTYAGLGHRLNNEMRSDMFARVNDFLAGVGRD
jgi:phospholipase/carboxylesterase